jgi:hypothetical protein
MALASHSQCRRRPDAWNVTGSRMEFDVEMETVRTLNEGLASVPEALERSQTAAFARWERKPYGAVFFVRRWRNDQYDTDCAITGQDASDAWLPPMGYSGGGFPDPFQRPDDGWDGQPIVWFGEDLSSFGEDEDITVVRAVNGMASRSVAELEVFDSAGNLFDRVAIRDDTGIFLIGLVGEDTYRVVARDINGAVVHDEAGSEARYDFEYQTTDTSFMDLLHEGFEDGGFGFMELNANGDWLIERDGGKPEPVTDPGLAAALNERRISNQRPWPRRVEPGS